MISVETVLRLSSTRLRGEKRRLAEDVDKATISNVDGDELEAHDFLYEKKFSNTYTNGREIVIKISIENEIDMPEAKNNRFIDESPAVQTFSRGVIYHINPVGPPRPETVRGQDAS